MPKRLRLYERQSYAVHTDQINYLVRMAFRRKLSISELVRLAIDEFMERNPLTKPRKATTK